MSYGSWDIETTVHNRFKRKANPFIPENWVVTHGFKFKDEVVKEHRFGKRDRVGPGWFKEVLRPDLKLLIGMNIKFDLLYALQDPENLDAWMDYVVRGGTVWDIQLAEYLLNGMAQEHHMLSLDEIAPRYGGNLKVDEVKRLWEAGMMTEDIEPELLTRYLIGGKDEFGVFQMGDVENTEAVALKQIQRARESGQLNSILLNMGALMFTAEAERNGMYVDKNRGLEIAGRLKVTIDQLRVELDKYLPKLPDEFEWKWTSRPKLSALIFGGTVKYEATHVVHADGTSTDQADWKVQALEGTAKDPVYYLKTEKVPEVDETGFPIFFKSGLNKGLQKTKNVTRPDIERGPKTRKGDSFFTFPRMTEPSPEWEGEVKGVYSVAEDVIEALGNRDIPFLKALSRLAKLTKDLGTYYITTDEKTGEQKGMLTLVGLDGLVHHKLNMTNTVTARLSSSDPNLQNLSTYDESKADTSEVKTLFVSRWLEDGTIIQSDFTSLEVYVQAILTGAKQLIADLKAGLDMHVLRYSAKIGEPYEDVLRKAKKEKIPEYVRGRQGSKEFSFQRAYGAGVAKIALTTGMKPEDIEELIRVESLRYPEVDIYYDKLTHTIRMNRKPTSRFVPHPNVPGKMVQLGRSFARTPDGKLYSYQESPSPEFIVKHRDPNKRADASFSPTEIKNYVVQGTGGEWAKAAMYLALVEFYRRKNFGGLALLVNQVHDAIYSDAHKKVADAAAAVLHAAMEAASEYMEWKFKWDVPVPVPTETEYGASMADHGPVPNLKEEASTIRKSIRDLHMGGYVPSFERN